jgi:hypothetical protein
LRGRRRLPPRSDHNGWETTRSNTPLLSLPIRRQDGFPLSIYNERPIYELSATTISKLSYLRCEFVLDIFDYSREDHGDESSTRAAAYEDGFRDGKATCPKTN